MRLDNREKFRKTARRFFAAVMLAALIPAALPACAFAAEITVGQAPGTVSSVKPGPGQGQAAIGALHVQEEQDTDFELAKFCLPYGAEMLVVVEGTGGSDCMVYAYEKENGDWKRKVKTYGYLGLNGMSNHRTSGDKTTPIGLFRMNTPFGQKDAKEGFPSNYLKVGENHVWLDATNKMTENAKLIGFGEAVGTHWYAGYYDYAIDAGFNPNGLASKGSALFLHCIKEGRTDTSGCVAIPTEDMITVMRMYGAHGDGNCYIAQAPKGTFDLVYNSFGVNNGLSPDGDFTGTAE